MAQEKQFVAESLKRMQIEEFLQKQFSRAGYSHSEIQRTPLSMRVTIYAHKPGLIIGRGGKNIEMIADKLSKDFGFENPQIDVQEIRNPDLDPEIVSKQIASAIERGFNYKRIANITIQRVMGSGAVGVAIRIGGKVGGEMSRVEKFSAGYLKFAGDPADTLVRKAYARAQVKLGTIGIQVRILPELPTERLVMKKIEQLTSQADQAAIPAVVAEEKKEEPKKKAKKKEKAEAAPQEEKNEEPSAEVKEEPKVEEPKEEQPEEIVEDGNNKEESAQRDE